ncbi:MAG: copper-translocating P-type ATPase [Oligoflexus sp.]
MENHTHQHQESPNHDSENNNLSLAQRNKSDHSHKGHGHHQQMIADFRKRLWISLALTVPIMALSEMIQHWFGFTLEFPGSNELLFVLSSIVFFYGGWPFLKGFYQEINELAPGMMTLIALAISVAYLFSSAVSFGFPGEDFFWELATLIDIMLLGHLIEMKSVMGASRALELLVNMMPSHAHKLVDDELEDVKIEDLSLGDLILIKPGEKIPADGLVEDGETYVNESMLTGESKPVKKSRSHSVIGGSINGNGSLKVKISRTGEDSYLSRVIGLVQEAQNTKSKTQNLANRAAKWLTYIALIVGFGTLLTWQLIGASLNFSIERMVTVMVISCPHALGLAVPLVVAISTAVSAQNGLLIRNRTAFENARLINTMVFDKTGTLTKGEFGVTRVEVFDKDLSKDQLFRYASAVEHTSEHPIAVGIIKKAKERGIAIPEIENFRAITGKGVEATVDGKDIKVVSPGYLRDREITIPFVNHSYKAETVVYIIIDNHVSGLFALSDEIRPESFDAIKEFKRYGIQVMMATGDNENVAQEVANKLNLDGYFAEVLPHQKLEIVQNLQSKGSFVAMTGDGINDAPALAQADVGIAVGSGTDVAAETADIILVNSNPKDILKLILFGRATYKKMIQNLWWAAGYNILAIPLAAGILYNRGFVLEPALGAVLMSLSTVVVAINAQLLRGKIS